MISKKYDSINYRKMSFRFLIWGVTIDYFLVVVGKKIEFRYYKVPYTCQKEIVSHHLKLVMLKYSMYGKSKDVF